MDTREHTSRPGAPAASLGSRLRARRKALGISAAATAEAAHISRVTLHRLEKDQPTVALGSLLAVTRVLDMELQLQARAAQSTPAEPAAGDGLPLQIRLDDYPQLRSLAWQVGDALPFVSPREALGLYQRNWRHLQPEALEQKERKLIAALRLVFGADDLHV